MAMLPHDYTSTACLHGFHEHCQAPVTRDGRVKTPAQCKFCGSACQCECHKQDAKR